MDDGEVDSGNARSGAIARWEFFSMWRASLQHMQDGKENAHGGVGPDGKERAPPIAQQVAKGHAVPMWQPIGTGEGAERAERNRPRELARVLAPIETGMPLERTAGD